MFERVLCDEGPAAASEAAGSLQGPVDGPVGRFRVKMQRRRLQERLQERLFAPPGAYQEIRVRERYVEPWDGDNDRLGQLALQSVYADPDALMEPDDERRALCGLGVCLEGHECGEFPRIIHITGYSVRWGRSTVRVRELLEMEADDLLLFADELGVSITRAGEHIVLECEDCGPRLLHYRPRHRERVTCCHYLLLRPYRNGWRAVLAD